MTIGGVRQDKTKRFLIRLYYLVLVQRAEDKTLQ